MNKLKYMIYRLAVAAAEAASRFWNAARHKGSTHQTTSSRAYQEVERPLHGQAPNPAWIKRRNDIDLFFLNLPLWREANHCENAYRAEVKRAWTTLERNNAIHDYPDPYEAGGATKARQLVV